MLRSTDGGVSWTLVPRFQELYQLPWWEPSFMNNNSVVDFNWGMSTALRFSPWGDGEAWLGDSWNMWLSPNFNLTLPGNANKTTEVLQWVQQPYGHEEVFVLSLAMPHAGPLLLSGTADLSGVVHQGPSLSEYPSFCWFGGPWGWGAEGTGIDYTELLAGNASHIVPARIVVAHTRSWPHQGGQGGGKLYVSNDGATTWTPLFQFNASFPMASPGGVAIAAYDPDTMLVININDVPLRSADGGLTWAPVPSLPAFPYPYAGYSGNRYNMSRPLVADRPSVQPPAGSLPVFYYHCAESGRFHVSVDGGATFSHISDLPPSPRTDVVAHHSISATGGTLWVALDKEGLYYTSDGGKSFTKNAGMAVAHSISVGTFLGQGPHPTEPVVYVFGLSAADTGDLRPYTSMDRGATWIDISSTNGFGLGNWPEVMSGSRRVPGLVVIGSFGTSATWANVTQALLQA
jgi:hypothetical protein